MSKKVGIITQHRVVNYGSVLQTYALQEKIKDMGYECEVIDYYPERFTPLGMLKRIKNKGEKFQKSFLIRNAARAIIIPSYIIRFRMFFKFLNDYIDMTPKTYKSEKELESRKFLIMMFIVQEAIRSGIMDGMKELNIRIIWHLLLSQPEK